MTSRQRIRMALRHQQPDRVPKDLGGSVVSSIHCDALIALRKRLGLEERLCKLVHPPLMLAEVEEDVRQALGLDVVWLPHPNDPFGYRNDQWRVWRRPNGVEVLVGVGFQVTDGGDGYLYAYPEGGDTTKEPSFRMPRDGYYFDPIVRQQNLDHHAFHAREDYKRDFCLLSEGTLRFLEKTSKELYEQTDYALFGNLFPGGLGDFFLVPGPALDRPAGIRDVGEWMMAHYTQPEYVHECYAMQTEVGIENLERYRQAVGDRIEIIGINGTDFGTQFGPLISPDTYRTFYKPYHKQFNDWVHQHTDWKTFHHTCGSIQPFMEDFIEAGFDIVNPVQISAVDMDPATLKERYGDRIVFWGGGCNPQSTMPFGTPEQVAAEAQKNAAILGKNGGYVLGNVHNIQSGTPAENIMSLYGVFA